MDKEPTDVASRQTIAEYVTARVVNADKLKQDKLATAAGYRRQIKREQTRIDACLEAMRQGCTFVDQIDPEALL